jgi:hypothetical protein
VTITAETNNATERSSFFIEGILQENSVQRQLRFARLRVPHRADV